MTTLIMVKVALSITERPSTLTSAQQAVSVCLEQAQGVSNNMKNTGAVA